VECTVNRVGDRYLDQLKRTGHERRLDDIDRLAALGIQTIRYPVLWERVAPNLAGAIDWSWADERIARLKACQLRPILGLVHHGSGPCHVSLISSEFGTGLATYAARVAERYPWVDAYTPVNEPLTTARFSGLYGFWYPHGSDDRTFATTLLNQCRAVVLAMTAIRAINSAAMLIQTEDLGETHSPPSLAYQAEFENHRRWITWDLLCGVVNRQHPLWEYFQWVGIPEGDVLWFRDHPCPPNILGVNHYITSERYLDDRLDRYPAALHGGNGRSRYADVEAVRVLPSGPVGPRALLRQAWERYGLPIAVTEAHLGCTREEQLRWLRDVWDAACAARNDGADIRAVTAWSAFGACDWDSLVTRDAGHLEPGLFDVRTDPPRPTALASLVRQLAIGVNPDHPVLSSPGWWHRPERLFGIAPTPQHTRQCGVRPLIITAANTGLGQTLVRLCTLRSLPFVAYSRQEMDTANPAAIATALKDLKPWAVINAGGYGGVEAAESDRENCRRENAIGPAVLAGACASQKVRFVTFSTDLVFDGQSARPYRELDAVAPLNVYGITKAEGETEVLRLAPHALVVRTGALFGSPAGGRDFVRVALQTVAAGQIFVAANDLTVTPCYMPDLVHAVLDLLIDAESGVFHLASPEPVTWAQLASHAVELAGSDMGLVEGCPASRFGWRAALPAYTPLAGGRGGVLPQLSDCLRRFIRDEFAGPAA
jgi:dTDP-4-dehydrorhamnose reductase